MPSVMQSLIGNVRDAVNQLLRNDQASIPFTEVFALVFQRVYNTIHRLNLYLQESYL